MKKPYVIGALIMLSVLACKTPSTQKTPPSDSIMNSGKPAPDSVKTDTTQKL